MPYGETKKTSDMERRLERMRRELYGKEQLHPKLDIKPLPGNSIHTLETEPQTASLKLSDVSYLKRDLIKTLILASIAVSAQTLLYLKLNNLF